MAFAIDNNYYYAPHEPIVNLAAAPMTHTAGYLTLPASARQVMARHQSLWRQ